jgi:hypothetical protein
MERTAWSLEAAALEWVLAAVWESALVLVPWNRKQEVPRDHPCQARRYCRE